MIWGSFNTTELLVEYMRLRWIQNPQVLSILALTSLQREGKAVDEVVGALNTEKTTISRHATQIDKIQKDFTVLKNDNPTLR